MTTRRTTSSGLQRSGGGGGVVPLTYKQASNSYRTPRRPGFVGGYRWATLRLALLSLFFVNVAATQYVAWMFSSQPTLGAPLLRAGTLAVYAPYSWLTWLLTYGTASDPRTRFALLLGPLVVSVGILATLGLVYLQNMRRLRALSANTEHLHGSARWADENDLREAGVLGQRHGVYIGAWYNEQNGSLEYLRDDGPSHTLIVAPPRTGKTVGLVIPTLFGWDGSAVVNDVKGEIWEKTAGYRHAMGQVCLRFSPVDETGRGTRFNPLREIRVGTLHDVADAQNMANVLVRNIDDHPTDTHWVETAASLVTTVLLHICYRAYQEGREANLAELVATFSIFQQSFRDTLTEMALYEHDPEGRHEWLVAGKPSRTHPAVLDGVQQALERLDREFSSVLSTVNRALAVYLDPLVQRNTAASDFTVNDLVNFARPISLYIVVPPSDRIRLAPLLRVLITLIANRLTERLPFDDAGTPARHRHRLLLLLDEFPTLGKMEVFSDALAYMAGYGIKCQLICQDFTQLARAYGPHHSIVSNCHVRCAFAPNNLETAEVLSRMTGTGTVEMAEFSYSGSRGAAVLDRVTESVRHVQRPLMTPDEILRIQGPKSGGPAAPDRLVSPGEMLIFVSGHPPIRGTQMLYFLDPAFSQHALIRPPLHLHAIEDDKLIPQRPLAVARHTVSRPEGTHDHEREPRPRRTTPTDQPTPPAPNVHDELAALANPHHVRYVQPPSHHIESLGDETL